MKQRAGRIANVIAALVVTAALVYVAAAGAGPLPPLGPAFNPGTGAWTAATDAALPRDAALHLAGLDRTTQVTFESGGAAHIQAAADHDLFWTIGYLHARFRLFQMDLMRRQGEGLLSEIAGPDALSTDEYYDRLGLERTARAEWSAMAPDSPAGRVLSAYTDGVNARIREDEQAGNLPLMFKMLGYQPRPWTPLDTLVIQGDMTQSLDFTDTPLDYALLTASLGYRRTMQWFPILPPDAQRPYDPGPYGMHGVTPIPARQRIDSAALAAVAGLARQFAALPSFALHHGANSNNWAVDGAKTASGKPLLAGDPHLHQTLPAIWYQLSADAPDYHFSGVTIPGVPIILIGHNRHIAWSLTNVQNQATLFYLERTDAAHPDQYYWHGAWRRMGTASYSIPVKGGSSVHLDVKLTVHGSIWTDDRLPGRSIAVDWMGALPSPDIQAGLDLVQASDFRTFRAALRAWYAPSQNVVYADDRGNIGLISAGYYPIVRGGAAWLPLPGTGEADVVGTIPYQDVPQIYDPPSHIVFSANQRPVAGAYPYYIGTTLNFFDNGYRADEIYSALQHGTHLTVQDMERLQTSTHDYLAGVIVPRLLGALQGQRLSAREARARALLRAWDGTMGVDSAAATIWWSFWSWYRHDTFQPWWDAYHVPYRRFGELAVDAGLTSLDEDLEAWTLHDPANAAFSPPGRARGAAPDVMRRAFAGAVRALTTQLGSDPSAWRWGRVHAREFDSVAQVPSLGYGPRPSSGDLWTVNAADNGPVSTSGPSWRFIMDWGAKQAEGVYPGGQSENPLSPWYANQVSAWWDGRYYPMRDAAAARAQPGSATWTLLP